MKISVLIPCYNEEETIEKIVNKILDLKDLDLEIIIVDDYSTELIKKYYSN